MALHLYTGRKVSRVRAILPQVAQVGLWVAMALFFVSLLIS